MPSLRDSGKIVGTSVSIRQLARQCNLPFPLSLRQFINAPRCPFDRGIRLHVKVLTNPNTPIETMLNRMREVYNTAGIRVEVVSRENLTGPAFATLDNLDVGACQMGTTTAEQNQLFQNRNNAGNNEIVVYFVQTTEPAFDGCAAHPPNQPGCVVDQTSDEWVLAHEVGHVLELEHISGEDCATAPSTTRLMSQCWLGNIIGAVVIDQGEIDTMRGSDLVRDV